MKLLFVHGWSVTNQDTYGQLPQALQAISPPELALDVHHIHLGKYISFHDEVTLEDIARAFDKARTDAIGETPFSCITHSTGGPVVRLWAHLFYGNEGLKGIPLKHLVMLAPANHGSALAQLGKSKMSRIMSRLEGVEPGVRVLDWLELGSQGQLNLNTSWLKYQPAENNFFPFVISGQTIDTSFYDFINSYLVEKGSDGVVRLCSANMNYSYVKLQQDATHISDNNDDLKENSTSELTVSDGYVNKSPLTPFGVIPKASHSGNDLGIMKSVSLKNTDKKPVVESILDCLLVTEKIQYKSIIAKFDELTKQTQENDNEVEDQYAMLIFRIVDDRGNPVNDFDMLLLAGANYQPNILPTGFFMDRQKNKLNRNILTYYLDCTQMRKAPDGKIGFRISARPNEGFSYYTPAEFRSNGTRLDQILIPNQTLLIDIVLKRHVDKQTFRLTPLADGSKYFKKDSPSGEAIP